MMTILIIVKKYALILVIGLIAYLSFFTSKPANAQELQWPSNQSLISVYNTGWRYVMQSGCPQPIWKPDFTSFDNYQSSIAPLQAELLTRIGTLPTKSAGMLLESHTIVENSRYSIQWVRLTSRLPGISVFGYLARPVGIGSPTPAVVVLHGGGVPSHSIFGWRLNGDEPFVDHVGYPDQFPGKTNSASVNEYEFANHVKYPDPLPFSDLGISLVDAGYTVFVPWLSDDWRWYWWYEYDRWGEIQATKLGHGNAYGLLVPQVMASIDFLNQDAQTQKNQIAIIGWEQGAQAGAITAAFDKRINAFIWLGPPIDKRRWRLENFDTQYKGAAFEQMDCAFGQVELAALLAPRPLLFSASTADSAYKMYDQTSTGSYISSTVYTAIQSLYDGLGAPTNISNIVNDDLHIAAAVTPRDWLNQQFVYATRQPITPELASGAPLTWTYPITDHTIFRHEIAQYLAELGACPASPIEPNYLSLDSFMSSVKDLRTSIYSTLGKVEQLPERPITIIERMTVATNDSYTLEWIRFRARFLNSDDYIGGFLATPLGGLAQKPAVLSFMGYERAGWSFAIQHKPLPYPYLNNYGDYLARAGNIVFMPIIDYSFDAWGAALNVRTNRTSNIWNFLLPFYMSSIDFLHSQPNVDTDRIAAYGLSYGGLAALYTTAVDQRISTLIYSNFTMNSQSIMIAMANVSMPIWFTQVCSMTNQVLPFLIAPRRMVWENGVGDYLNGFFEKYPTEIPDQVQQTYKNLGLGQRFQFIQHDGYHETRPWLFTVFYPKIQISDLNPSVISATSPMSLQITGSNFLTSPIVLLDNVPISTTFVDSTKLVAILPSGLSEGNHTVTVQNSDSYSTTTSLLVDRTPPVGMISNTDQILLSNHITLSLLSSDALSGVDQMRISETSFDLNSPWQPYQPSTEWFFSKDDGNKVIYTQFRDLAGNVSQVYTQSFLLDTSGPTGTLTINKGALDTISRDVMLDLDADDHDGTGVSNLFLSNNGTSFEQPISMTNSVPWQLLDGMGAQTVYVRYQDNSGQFSSLISATVNLTNVNNLATGVSINNGDQFINNSDAVLTLIAPEYTSEMAIREFADKLVSTSNANLDDLNAWIWEPYAVKRMWAFNDYGPNFPKRTIYVQFRDVSGDVSQTYFSNIYLDMTPPQGTVTSNVLQNQYTTSPNITLTLQASDDVSGVDKMRIATESDIVRVSLQAFSETIPWTLDSTDGEKTIYVQYQDRANNLSEVYQTTVILDTTPPQIKSAGWKEESGSQKLEFEVTDTLSGMDAMQISKDLSFAEALWMPFSSSLNSPQFASNQVVYVHFRDRAGNISAILSIQPLNRLFLPFAVR